MTVGEVLVQLGGVATRAQLLRATSRSAVDAALASGEVVVLARGRYALPNADDAVKAAHRLSGVLDRFSAALHHGWGVWNPPLQPQVAVPRHRIGATGADVSRPRLGPDDVSGIATTQDRTLADCLRTGPFTDALAVADSALRDGYPRARLLAIARDLRGPGSAGARRAASCADGRADNPFESALRAIALEVPGLHVVPQVSIRSGTFRGRPDLVDERLGIVLEADSFAWHGDRQALARDARRYNLLAVDGWLVLRFTWEEVHQPSQVTTILRSAVHLRTKGCRCGRRAA